MAKPYYTVPFGVSPAGVHVHPLEASPVTLGELKQMLGIVHTDDDYVLMGLIAEATEALESDCRKLFSHPRTVTESFDRFPFNTIGDPVELQRVPVTSVTSVTYRDADSVSQSYDLADLNIDLTSVPARIQAKQGAGIPSTDEGVGAVQIEYLAGYTDLDDVPMLARQAILSRAMDQYNCRGTQSTGSPEAGEAWARTVDRLRWGL